MLKQIEFSMEEGAYRHDKELGEATKHSGERIQEKQPFVFSDMSTFYGEDDKCQKQVEREGAATKNQAEDLSYRFDLHTTPYGHDWCNPQLNLYRY